MMSAAVEDLHLSGWRWGTGWTRGVRAASAVFVASRAIPLATTHATISDMVYVKLEAASLLVKLCGTATGAVLRTLEGHTC